jgi:hypothetical protein
MGATIGKEAATTSPNFRSGEGTMRAAVLMVLGCGALGPVGGRSMMMVMVAVGG